MFQDFIETLPTFTGYHTQDLFGMWTKVYDPLFCEVKEKISKINLQSDFLIYACFETVENIFLPFLADILIMLPLTLKHNSRLLYIKLKTRTFSLHYLCCPPLENCRQNYFSSMSWRLLIFQPLRTAGLLSWILMKKTILLYRGKKKKGYLISGYRNKQDNFKPGYRNWFDWESLPCRTCL